MSERPRFNSAKAFSDFIGFHVRAVFCMTLAVAAFFPVFNDLFLELLTFGNKPINRSLASFWISVTAFLTFLVFFVVIVIHIFRTALEYLDRRKSGIVSRVISIFILGVAEFSALLAIPLFVFTQLPILSDGLGGGALPQEVRRCLLDDLVHQNGIALGQPARPECPELLREFRIALGIIEETVDQ